MRRMTGYDLRPTPLVPQWGAHPADSESIYLETLERRLADGYARIEEARTRGQDVTAWEEFWIDLLHQYEAAVDGLPEAA